MTVLRDEPQRDHAAEARARAGRETTWLVEEVERLGAITERSEWERRKADLDRTVARLQTWFDGQAKNDGEIEKARHRLQAAEQTLIVSAPPATATIVGEQELCAAIRRVARTSDDRSNRRIAILRAALAVDVAGRKQLARRIRSGRSDDELVQAITGRCNGESVDELLGVLDGRRVVHLPSEPKRSESSDSLLSDALHTVSGLGQSLAESAEPLLAPIAAKPEVAPKVSHLHRATVAAPHGEPTPLYVHKFLPMIMTAVSDRVSKTGLSQPHARLHWTVMKDAVYTLIHGIRAYVDAVPDLALKRLMELSQPADLLAIVDDLRRDPGGVGWRSEIGIAIATAFDEPIHRSIETMGLRLRVQLDGAGAATSLVASCPLDRVLGEVLVRPELVTAAAAKATHDTGARPFANGVHEVEYEWQGKHDPALWNWIRVTSPNATAEDVAHTPLAGGEVIDGAEQAYRIAASPPFFGIPFETAQRIPEAVKYAPANLNARFAHGEPGPRYADRSALARSVVSDEAALAQAPASGKHDLPLEHALERAGVQIEFMWRSLAPWNATGPLTGATLFIDRRRAELSADQRGASKWAPVIAAQERVLFAAASESADVLAEIEKRGVKPSDAQAFGPVVHVLEAYAEAAGVSHLGAEAQTQLAAARRQRALLPLALAEDKVRAARRAVADQQGAQIEANRTEQCSDQTIASLPKLATTAADLRLDAERGALDADDIDQLAVDADEVALRARIVTLQTQVHTVELRAADAGISKDQYSGGFPTLQAVIEQLRPKIAGWKQTLDGAKRWKGPINKLSPKQTSIHQMQSAIRDVATSMTIFARQAELEKWFQWAYERIGDQQLRNALISMALQIGIMIVTGEVAGAAVIGLRGLALGTGLISGLRGAGAIYKGLEVVLQAGLATGSQAAMGGPAGRREFAENALGIVLTNAAMKPFEGLFADSVAVEGEVVKWAQRATRGGKVVAEIAVSTGAGIAASSVAHAATHGEDATMAASDDVIVQGIALAASKLVHQRTKVMHERIEAATKQLGSKAVEGLLRKIEALAKRTESANPTREEAMAQLEEQNAQLHQEQGLYAGHAGSDAAKHNAAEINAVDAQFADAPFRLSGLTPVVKGQTYEGTAAQIHDALVAAQNMGVPVQRAPSSERGVQRITIKDHVIELRETGVRSTEPPTARQAEARRAMAREAIANNERRSVELGTLIEGIDNPKLKHVTIGEGVAATLSHSTQEAGHGAAAGPIKELPETIAIAENRDWWQILGDRDIGQPVTDHQSSGYWPYQPGDFNPDHHALGRASDIAYANAMTAQETGMVTLKGRVTAVEEFTGEAKWSVAARWRLQVNDRKWIYTDSVAFGGGLGAPRKLKKFSESFEKTLLSAGRLSYAQDELVPPVAEGGTIVVIGDGATAGWAAQEAERTGRKAIIIAQKPSLPGVPAQVRKELTKRGVTIVQGNVVEASIEGAAVILTLSNDLNQSVKITGDGVSLAIGQVVSLPRGFENQHFRAVKSRTNGKERVVALEAYDPTTQAPTGLVVQGAAMATPPFKDGPKPFVDDREGFVAALRQQANDPDVPELSRGIEPSIHQSAINIPLSNKRTP